MNQKVLDLETRRKIYELIVGNPGLHMREISRQSGLLPSLVEYHLRYLIKNELVYTVKEQNSVRYYDSKEPENGFDKSSLNTRQKKILHLLRKKIPMTIVLLILEKGMAKHKDIFYHLNITPSKISYYLKKLVQYEVLVNVRTGHDKGYWIRDKEELLKILVRGHINPPTQVDGFIKTWEEFY